MSTSSTGWWRLTNAAGDTRIAAPFPELPYAFRASPSSHLAKHPASPADPRSKAFRGEDAGLVGGPIG